MANIDIKRLPFANYDLVVYFGIGVLALPLVHSYILVPFGIRLPSASASLISPFVRTAIETILVLFAAYAIGHITAFISGYLVEGFVHKWLNYPSDLWLSICNKPEKKKAWHVVHSGIINTKPNIASIGVAAFHIPLFPWYMLIHTIGAFGFYMSKLSPDFRAKIRSRLKEVGLDTPITHGYPWPKVLEHYVANNCPAGYVRLYNYLVIFGVLRSLAFVAIAYSWVLMAKLFLAPIYDEHNHIVALTVRPLFSPTDATSYAVLSLFATLTVMAFGKFNRRHFEEAVYSFVLSGRNPTPEDLPTIILRP